MGCSAKNALIVNEKQPRVVVYKNVCGSKGTSFGVHENSYFNGVSDSERLRWVFGEKRDLNFFRPCLCSCFADVFLAREKNRKRYGEKEGDCSEYNWYEGCF